MSQMTTVQQQTDLHSFLAKLPSYGFIQFDQERNYWYISLSCEWTNNADEIALLAQETYLTNDKNSSWIDESITNATKWFKSVTKNSKHDESYVKSSIGWTAAPSSRGFHIGLGTLDPISHKKTFDEYKDVLIVGKRIDFAMSNNDLVASELGMTYYSLFGLKSHYYFWDNYNNNNNINNNNRNKNNRNENNKNENDDDCKNGRKSNNGKKIARSQGYCIYPIRWLVLPIITFKNSHINTKLQTFCQNNYNSEFQSIEKHGLLGKPHVLLSCIVAKVNKNCFKKRYQRVYFPLGGNGNNDSNNKNGVNNQLKYNQKSMNFKDDHKIPDEIKSDNLTIAERAGESNSETMQMKQLQTVPMIAKHHGSSVADINCKPKLSISKANWCTLEKCREKDIDRLRHILSKREYKKYFQIPNSIVFQVLHLTSSDAFYDFVLKTLRKTYLKFGKITKIRVENQTNSSLSLIFIAFKNTSSMIDAMQSDPLIIRDQIMCPYCVNLKITNDCVVLQTIFCDVIWDLASIIVGNNYYGFDSEALWNHVHLVCKHDNSKHEARLALKRYFHLYGGGEEKAFVDKIWSMSPFKYIFNAYHVRQHIGAGKCTTTRLMVELKGKWNMDDIKQILICATKSLC